MKNAAILLGFSIPIIAIVIQRYMTNYVDVDFMEKDNITNFLQIRNFLNRSKLDQHSKSVDSGILRNHMDKCK